MASTKTRPTRDQIIALVTTGTAPRYGERFETWPQPAQDALSAVLDAIYVGETMASDVDPEVVTWINEAVAARNDRIRRSTDRQIHAQLNRSHDPIIRRFYACNPS